VPAKPPVPHFGRDPRHFGSAGDDEHAIAVADHSIAQPIPVGVEQFARARERKVAPALDAACDGGFNPLRNDGECFQTDSKSFCVAKADAKTPLD
jgi:hypothetical protein